MICMMILHWLYRIHEPWGKSFGEEFKRHSVSKIFLWHFMWKHPHLIPLLYLPHQSPTATASAPAPLFWTADFSSGSTSGGRSSVELPQAPQWHGAQSSGLHFNQGHSTAVTSQSTPGYTLTKVTPQLLHILAVYTYHQRCIPYE